MAVTRATAAVAAVVIGLTASGCSSSQDASSTAPSPETSPSPSSSAPTTTATPAEDAQAQAIALVSTYLRTIDDLYLDPSRPLDDIYEVAVGSEATTEATAIGTFRTQQYRQVGRMQLVTASADEFDLDSDPVATPSPDLPAVVITACLDVSQVEAVDASGDPVVPASRPRYLVSRLTVVNPRYPDASTWRVSEADNRQAQSCDG